MRLTLLLENFAIVCRLEKLKIGDGTLLIVVYHVIGLIGLLIMI